MKGLAVDLVIWNEDDSVYRQTLQDAIMDLIAASPEATLVDKPGGIFVRRGEQMSEEDRVLLQTVARVILLDDAGTLAEQVERRGRAEVSIPALKPTAAGRPEPPTAAATAPARPGVLQRPRRLQPRRPRVRHHPRPRPDHARAWVNVIANPQFGTVVSESGSAYTWARTATSSG